MAQVTTEQAARAIGYYDGLRRTGRTTDEVVARLTTLTTAERRMCELGGPTCSLFQRIAAAYCDGNDRGHADAGAADNADRAAWGCAR